MYQQLYLNQPFSYNPDPLFIYNNTQSNSTYLHYQQNLGYVLPICNVNLNYNRCQNQQFTNSTCYANQTITKNQNFSHENLDPLSQRRIKFKRYRNNKNLVPVKKTNCNIQMNFSKKLNIASFNAQSLGRCCQDKRILVNEFIKDNDIDIMFFQETWFNELGDEGLCAELAPKNYTAISYPRSNHGGGLAVVFKNTLEKKISIKTDFEFSHRSFEVFNLVLKTSNRPIIFWNIYRTFPRKSKNNLSDQDFHDEFPEILNLCNEKSNCDHIILGDFNFHFDDLRNSNTKKMIDLLDIFDLTQLVTTPTHKAGHIIDWVISKQNDNIAKNTSIVYDLISDHYCIKCELSVPMIKTHPAYKELRNIKGINRTNFRHDLDLRLSMYPCESIDELNDIFQSLLDKHAPSKISIIKPQRDPVHDSVKEELFQLKKEKRSAEKKYLKTGLTIHNDIFEHSKRKIAKLVKKGRSMYLNSKITDSTTNKELYDICKNLTGSEKRCIFPTNYPFNELPNIFSNFFSSKIENIRAELDQMKTDASTILDSLIIPNPSVIFNTFLCVSEEDVKKIILNSKPTTCPLDCVPTLFLLEFIDEILPSLTAIINKSLLSGSFPNSLKMAIIRPLLKKPSLDIDILKNYRPVSTLSFFSKIFEKVVLKQLLSFLNTNQLLSPNQSAYRTGHSTETALIKITNDILTALDHGDTTILTLLDLSAAFDTVDHCILFHLLEKAFNISGNVLSWFTSYLSSRSQTVMINSLKSESKMLKFGVPQGSVLGPILFIMYTKSLHNVISKHNLQDQSFADDTQLYQSCKPININSCLSDISLCIDDVKRWMHNHKLKLNDEKTEILLCHSKSSFQSQTKPTSLSIGSSNIIFTHSAKNLGFIISDDMSVDKQVNNICRSCYAALRRISAIRKYLTIHTTTVLICSFVLSRLDYGNALLIGSPKYLIAKLQKVQNAAARLIHKSRKNEHVTPLLKSLHWLPIHLRIHYKLSVLCFQFFEGSSPAYIIDLLNIYTPARNLRSSLDTRILDIPKVRSKMYGERSFSHSAPKIWNSLPFNLRHALTITSFKRQLKTHLFNQFYS